jgi:hypothetical protein
MAPSILRGRVDEDHAAMAADVVEHAHRAAVVAQQQERLAQEIERFRIARLGHVGADADGGPCGLQASAGFGRDGGRIGVMAIRQAARPVDRGAHVGEGAGALIFGHGNRPSR